MKVIGIEKLTYKQLIQKMSAMKISPKTKNMMLQEWTLLKAEQVLKRLNVTLEEKEIRALAGLIDDVLPECDGDVGAATEAIKKTFLFRPLIVIDD